jgi:hypothetical protein
MARTATFDEKYHASLWSRDASFLTLLKSTWDNYCESQQQDAKHEQDFEAEYQGLAAMAHWRHPKPSPCLHRCGRRHLLDDNPCSG